MKRIDHKHAEFRKHFDTDDEFQDVFLTTVMGKYVLDIVKLDDWLKFQHGYTEEADGSMKDFILNKFGQEAVDFVYSLISLEKES